MGREVYSKAKGTWTRFVSLYSIRAPQLSFSQQENGNECVQRIRIYLKVGATTFKPENDVHKMDEKRNWCRCLRKKGTVGEKSFKQGEEDI